MNLGVNLKQDLKSSAGAYPIRKSKSRFYTVTVQYCRRRLNCLFHSKSVGAVARSTGDRT